MSAPRIDENTASWRRSSYSNQDGGNCVEWAPERVAAVGAVPVRDSKRPGGPVLTLAPEAWSAFVDFARANG
ncbi:hypothetical protein GCM10012286_06720 [Streptomyces lasiicapitis]|uniref:DUF397 domain-containing protein n=1 Tax=Streptomyces lasiicapitis TaxID=1923961 RepID=A0ABQ2LIS3_9ACTN|nr:hypothetical protein GCM10012286_06720 [Streptomyces lasiicapitis]